MIQIFYICWFFRAVAFVVRPLGNRGRHHNILTAILFYPKVEKFQFTRHFYFIADSDTINISFKLSFRLSNY